MTDNTAPSLASIVGWIEQIRAQACRSFADVAMRLPEVWSVIRTQGPTRRTIAQSCGWPLTLGRDEIESLPSDKLGVTLLNFGADCATSLWQAAPRICHLMHVHAKLDDAYALVRASIAERQEDQSWILDDLELKACGALESGLRFDLGGVKRTMAARGEAPVRRFLPMMPARGCETAGGLVFDVPSLIVARVLEYSQLAFDAPEAVRDPVAREALPGGFHLTQAHVVLGFGKSRPSRYAPPSGACMHVVRVDDRLLESPAWMIGFLHHVVESLADVGVRADVCLDTSNLWRFLQPSPPASMTAPSR